ncbi:dihydrofolate reductase, partial [bacterium]|nr:dihydrofolate reductase [bacterium]
KCLPGRTTVIVTRQTGFSFPEAKIAHTIESAIELATDDALPFIVGGAEIYSIAMPYVDRIYLTRVHQEIDGDTHLPAIDWGQWELIQTQDSLSPESTTTSSKDEVRYTFEDYRRVSKT